MSSMLREWIILAAAILLLPTYALAQVQSGVQSGVRSGVQSGVRSGDHQYGNRKIRHRQYSGAVVNSSSCWRATVVRNGLIRVWNCQPYPPP